jgi:2-dehydro-3-deoxyphosphogalactonate aldolase
MNLPGVPRSDWPTDLPLVAILRGIRPDEVLAHTSALVNAGFDCIEVPTNSPDWAISVAQIVRHFGGRVLAGAGTVYETGQVEALLEAGGQLMVTPHTDPSLIGIAVARGLLTLIGCATATEAICALRAGSHVLKLFPAGVLGPAYVSALRSVLPAQTPLFAVGGVKPDNLEAFVRAGCTGAGLGGELYRAGQAPELTARRAESFVAVWNACLSKDALPSSDG